MPKANEGSGTFTVISYAGALSLARFHGNAKGAGDSEGRGDEGQGRPGPKPGQHGRRGKPRHGELRHAHAEDQYGDKKRQHEERKEHPRIAG